MRSIRYRVLAMLLILAALLMPVGCATVDDGIKKEGIEISPDAPHSAEAAKHAEEVIHELIVYGYVEYRRSSVEDADGSTNIVVSEAKAAELKSLASRVAALTLNVPLTEARYIQLFDTLAEDGKGVIDELISLKRGSSELSKTEALYTSLAAELGAESVTSLLYDICLLDLTIKHEKCVARYEKYGFSYLLEEIAAAEKNVTTFREGIGRDAFGAVIKNGFAAYALSRGGTDALLPFSAGEILTVLSHLELDGMSISTDGWLMLLSYITPSEGDGSYRASLINSALAGGGDGRAAETMNSLISLLSAMQKKLTAEDIEAAREDRGIEALGALLSRLDSTELALLKSVTELDLNAESCSALALTHYGEEYAEYLSGISVVSFEELCASFESAEFSDIMTDYMAGRFPAFTYEVLK